MSAYNNSSYTTGPHKSAIANKLDPRVDSQHRGQTTTTTTTTTTAGSHAQAPGGYTNGSGNAGPHSSKIANKLDPRVDSDLDGRAQRRGEYGTSTAGGYGNNATHPGNAYSSNTIGAGGITHGNQAGTRSAGLTSTNANADPMGSQNLNSSRSTGPARHTAGPHRSDLLNKLDPRVESDIGQSVNQGGSRHI